MKLQSFNPELQEKLEAFMQMMYEYRGYQFDPINLQTDIRNIKETYQKDGGDFWLIKESENITGCIALKVIDKNIGEIKRFFVLPAFQGQGLGKRLFAHAIDVALKNRLVKLRLDTMKNSERAMIIFKNNGFYEIERYNNNHIADIFMEKYLSIQICNIINKAATAAEIRAPTQSA